MQLRFKLFMPLLAVAMIFGLSNAAYAKVTCVFSTSPLPRATLTAHADPVGAMRFDCTAIDALPTTAQTMSIDIPGVIVTNDDDLPEGSDDAEIRFSATTADLFAVSAPTLIGIDNSGGTATILVAMPAIAVPVAADIDSFQIEGVLVSIADSGIGFPVNAVVGVTGTDFTLTGNNLAVLNNALDGLEPLDLDFNAVIFGDGYIFEDEFEFDIDEGYFDLFQDFLQFNSGFATDDGAGDQGVQILLDFDDIPAGIEWNDCHPVFSGADFDDILFDTDTINMDDDQIVITFDNPNQFTSDGFTVHCGDLIIDDDDFTGDPGTATVRATLFPTGDALDDGDIWPDIDDDGWVPRYEELFTDEIVVLQVIPNTTTMLVPFASTDNLYTVLGISNTTKDPFGDDGAVPQDGVITFYFCPPGSDEWLVWSTADNPGIGLGQESDGLILSGSTYLVNVQDILGDLGVQGPWTGYIIAVADFTQAHGAGYITDLAGITAKASLIGIENPLLDPRWDIGAEDGLENTEE